MSSDRTQQLQQVLSVSGRQTHLVNLSSSPVSMAACFAYASRLTRKDRSSCDGMEADKTCPVVLRGRETLEILAFEHPLAGFQLVKGSVEPGESSDLAAVRELKEEAGIQSTVGRHLGQRRCIVTGYTWAFHECHVAQDLPDTWMHFAEDDGGHEFRFFWHPLVSEPSGNWHQVFKDALSFLRKKLTEA